MTKSMSMKHVEGIMFSLIIGILVITGSAWPLEPITQKKDAQNLSQKEPYSPYVGRTYATDVFWGDTHVHTSCSIDAGLAGNYRLGPEEAYKFARGEEVISNTGMPVRLSQPLDFLVVADHAEYLGMAPKILGADPQTLATEYGKRWHDMSKAGPEEALKPIFEAVMSMMLRDEKIKDVKIKQSAWEYITNMADKYNDPGKFTTLIGFEWTSMPGPGNNLHRNVIFKDDAQKANHVLPFSLFDSEDPEDLWRYMANYEEKIGGQILAIPHNANLSNGLMYSVTDFKGNAITREYAEQRSRWEPLMEVTQMKGGGETHPFLSPEDEFADYET